MYIRMLAHKSASHKNKNKNKHKKKRENKMTNEERNESYRNNRKAWKWFEANGYPQHKGMVLHHKD